jgi:hypothetical protein
MVEYITRDLETHYEQVEANNAEQAANDLLDDITETYSVVVDRIQAHAIN